MKYMRKIFALVLAVIMVMSLATTAFADENTTSYEVYQIFTGDYSDGVLSNVKWGANGQETVGTAVSDAILTELEAVDANASNSDKLAIITKYANLTGTPFKTSTSDTISELPAGYYLIKDAEGSQEGENGVYTTYVVKVVGGSVTITRKVAVPTVEKEVNDTVFNIGETITYTLTGTLPSNYGDYKTYTYIFHDTLSTGLTADKDSVKVTLDTAEGTDITNMFDITYEGNVLTVSCKNLKTNANITASSKIIVTYNAVLNENAVIGGTGNDNKVYLEYSNDPNWNGDPTDPTTPPPTGDTPEKDKVVYTFDLPVFKYDGANNKGLAGAKFSLYDSTGAIVKLTAKDNNVYKVDPNGTVTEITTDETGLFTIEGLKDGTYTLTEVKAPEGYNSVADITVVIAEDGTITMNGSTITQVKVENNAGSTLPETGGMGTTLFYVFGAILMVGAAVLLVTKRRMNMAE